MWDDGHGKVHGKFTLDALTGAMLKKALLAIAAPKHRASQGPLGERQPTPERLGPGVHRAHPALPGQEAPQGRRAQRHRRGPHAARHPDGRPQGRPARHRRDHLARPARRLACEAGIIPAVLGGKSQVLDLGRKNRFHTEAQRIAKTIEAGGCEVDGCDAPPGMSHMHHPIRWVDGGETNRDAIMICPPHHARAHDPRYNMTKLPTGKYAFHRRT